MFTGADNAPTQSARTAARESFFLDFAKEIRARLPKMALIVTGGFQTRQGMEVALEEACDMAGIGRPSVINPSLPANIILNSEVKDADAKMFRKRVPTPWLLKKIAPKSIGAGVETVSFQPSVSGKQR